MPSSKKRLCGFHEVEHVVGAFYHYPKTETSAERWICKARESARQKAKAEKKSTAKKSTAKRPAAKKSTARKRKALVAA